MCVTSQMMQYDAAPSTPLPDCARGLTPDDVLPRAGRGGSCGGAGGNTGVRREHYARVIAALLYAAVGGLDQVARAAD